MSGNSGAYNFREEMHKVFVRPVEGFNVALADNGAKMVKSEMEANALNGDLETFTLHEIGMVEEERLEGIVIELRDNFVLNQIKFLLLDKDERSYSYFVEVSINGKAWTRICDYTNYFCRSWQLIVFPEIVTRYIKIVGTHNSLNFNFHVVTIEAYLAREEFELDRKWNLLGLMVPKTNVATLKHGAKVIKGNEQNATMDNMINGDLTRHLYNNFTWHYLEGQAIVLQLSQPFVLDSMRLLLWDDDDRIYSYEINVSTDLVKWKTIARKRNESSWQNIKFEPIPVVFVRIMGISSSANNGIHVIHFECPAPAASPKIKANEVKVDE